MRYANSNQFEITRRERCSKQNRSGSQPLQNIWKPEQNRSVPDLLQHSSENMNCYETDRSTKYHETDRSPNCHEIGRNPNGYLRDRNLNYSEPRSFAAGFLLFLIISPFLTAFRIESFYNQDIYLFTLFILF